MLVELTSDTLAEVIQANKKVAIQFSASWCGNCRIMKPKFKKLASEKEDIVFVIVDAEQFPESRKLANVTNLPTYANLEKRQLIRELQTKKQEQLNELIDEITRN